MISRGHPFRRISFKKPLFGARMSPIVDMNTGRSPPLSAGFPNGQLLVETST